MMPPIINIIMMEQSGKAIADMMQAARRCDERAEAEYRREKSLKEAERKRIEAQRRIEEDEYKRKHPHCTWMFEHFFLDDDCAINDDYTFKKVPPTYGGWCD